MKHLHLFFALILCSLSYCMQGQTKQDSLYIKQVALDYIESQHKVKPEQFERSAHPRMVKRTFGPIKPRAKSI